MLKSFLSFGTFQGEWVTEVNGKTVVQVTVAQLIYAGIIGVGALWAGAQLVFGGLKSDVADIRSAVTENQKRNADTQQTSTATDGELRAQIADLTAELRIVNAGLNDLTTSVSGLDNSIKSVDTRLADSISRQVNFERWVVTRLGQNDSPIPTVVPPEWQKAEGEVIKSLTTGDEPLSGWFRAVSEP